MTIEGIFGQPATVQEAVDQVEIAKAHLLECDKLVETDLRLLEDSKTAQRIAAHDLRLALYRLHQTLGLEH